MQAMQVSQTKHTMAVAQADPQLIGSGVNKTLAFIISDDFCFKAKKDGVITKIDLENKLCLLEYSDSTRDAIDLSDVLVKNSNGGFYTRQDFKMAYKENESFKKGDVIAFNPSFFNGKGKNIDYMPGALAKVAIASLDNAFEDSTLIAEKLAQKCKSRVTMEKYVALGPNSIIHHMVKKGEKVNTGDHLIEFTSSFKDSATTEFLANLAATLGDDAADAVGNDSVKTKYSGTVVDIKIYYNMAKDELSDSLRKLIEAYTNGVEKRRAALNGIKTESVHISPVDIQTRGKVGTTDYEGVLIIFYVEYEDVPRNGDKVTFQTALKAIVSKKVPDEEAPISDYRPEDIIEGLMTPTGIISRMVLDVYSTMASNKCLVEMGKQICEIWDGKR